MGSFNPLPHTSHLNVSGCLIVAIGTSAGDDDPRRDGLHHVGQLLGGGRVLPDAGKHVTRRMRRLVGGQARTGPGPSPCG